MPRCINCFEEYGANLKACPQCNTLLGAGKLKAYHLPTNTLLVERYIVGRAVCENSVKIKYKCFDQKRQKKVYIYEFFPLNAAQRDNDGNMVVFSTNSQADLFEKSLGACIGEVKELEAFSDCQGIEKINDYFIENNTCYVVCEYKEYVTLAAYMKKNKTLPYNKAVSIFNTIMYATKRLHSQKIVHGNITPEHIALCKDDSVELMDIGIACYVNSTSIAIYNPNYSSPEARGTNPRLTESSDVYSLAAVLYKLLTGVTPCDSEVRKNNEDELVPPRKLGIRINTGYENAILNALEPDSNIRYKSAQEFSDALKNKNTRRINKSKSRSLPLAAIVCGVVVVAFVAIGLGILTNKVAKMSVFKPRVDSTQNEIGEVTQNTTQEESMTQDETESQDEATTLTEEKTESVTQVETKVQTTVPETHKDATTKTTTTKTEKKQDKVNGKNKDRVTSGSAR